MRNGHHFYLGLVIFLTVSWVGTSFGEDFMIRNKVDVVGELWTVEKNLPEGTRTFIDPGENRYTEQEFIAATHAKEEATKIEPSLAARLEKMSPTMNTRVIITLRSQPYESFLKQAQEVYSSELEALRQEIQAVMERHRYSGPPLTREEEAARYNTLPEAEAELLQDYAEQIEAIQSDINSLASLRTAEATSQEQDFVASLVDHYGGSVNYRYKLFSGIASVVPAGSIEQLAAQPEVARVSEDQLMQAHLDVSVPSVGTEFWWSQGYYGGTWDVGIIDCGVDDSHPAFSGKAFVNQTFHATARTNVGCYNDNAGSTDDLTGHGTHVAGIVMSQGSSDCVGCQGVAKGLQKTYNLKAAFRNSCTGGASMYWSDMMAAVDWAQGESDGPDTYNLSYGSTSTSNYTDGAKFWDGVVAAKATPVSLSAGNTGPNNTNFTDPSDSYNAIIVANMDDKNTLNRTDDKIRGSSTRGPTNDGRKKPDLAAPGTNIKAPRYNWESYNDYVEYTGTSMAAPHVSGAYTLLWDYEGPAQKSVNSALNFKALLINTADSWSDNGTLADDSDDGMTDGSHWDGTYGWGYLNLDHANTHKADTLSGTTTDTERDIYYKGYMYQDDKATLVWNRRVLYNNANTPTTVYNLTDLDLYAYQYSNNHLLALSGSAIDNVEQVSLTSAADVILKVHQATTVLDGAATEPFGLATEEGFDRYYGTSRVGVFRPSNGALYLKNINETGYADTILTYGITDDKPVTGDWDGNSTKTIGVYRNGTFFLKNSNTLGYADITFPFGTSGDLPLAGDWDGDGVDTVGVYRNGMFFLRNSNSTGAPDMQFALGMAGDIPIAGDWTHKGYDTVGVFRPSNGALYLKSTNTTGYADIVCTYGIPGDKPVTGDWDGNGTDTIGIYRDGMFFLRNSNTNGYADVQFALGISGDEPISGDWLGLP